MSAKMKTEQIISRILFVAISGNQRAVARLLARPPDSALFL